MLPTPTQNLNMEAANLISNVTTHQSIWCHTARHFKDKQHRFTIREKREVASLSKDKVK
jgi:type IV secretory pathway TraG/TraD family ATPase VirD4